MSRVEYFSQCPRCSSQGRDTRGDNLAVYLDGSNYCFSCRYFKPSKHYVPRIEKNVSKALLPADFTWEVPSRAWQWVIQYGLPISYWQEFTGYSEAEERLVFRVGNPMQFSIGRYIGKENGHKKWYVWGDPHKHCEVLKPKDVSTNGDDVILVEDLISAHKVAQLFPSIPLFGTQIHPPILFYLSNYHSKVILWLDKDQELPAKRQALRLESLINKPVKVLTTEKDPKCLSLPNIQMVIESF